MSLLDMLKDMTPDEMISGSCVQETAEYVMLDIAYSPVIEYPVSEERLMFDVPTPIKITERPDGKYEIRRTNPPDFRIIDVAEAKEMRARFLLLKGYYAENMDGVAYPEQQKVIALYFGGSFLDVKKLFQT